MTEKKKKKGERAKATEKHRFARAERMRPSHDRVVEVVNVLEGMFFHLESGLLRHAIDTITDSDLNEAIFNIVEWERKNLGGKGTREALDLPDGDLRYSEVWIARLEEALDHAHALLMRGNFEIGVGDNGIDEGVASFWKHYNKHILPAFKEIERKKGK